ncbi:Uncharacterised protein [Elizabethkingia meningoseptica]|nr:Uncharacterised protein [Elizabethkingia meningoseptica]
MKGKAPGWGLYYFTESMKSINTRFYALFWVIAESIKLL